MLLLILMLLCCGLCCCSYWCCYVDVVDVAHVDILYCVAGVVTQVDGVFAFQMLLCCCSCCCRCCWWFVDVVIGISKYHNS